MLSPDDLKFDLNYNDESIFKADKFFAGLKSSDINTVYVSINRLIECYNDEELRLEAIEKIKPFESSNEEKLSSAAKFALDILTKTFESEYVYKMSDGSVVFAAFPNYSDYGSHNVLWRINDDKLEKVIEFKEPSYYISDISVSPDGKLVAVETCSRKSSFVTVFDFENGYISPELVGSARVICGQNNGEDVLMRIDGETYCDAENITWADNSTVSFEAKLTSDNYATVHDAVVEYDFSTKEINVFEE